MIDNNEIFVTEIRSNNEHQIALLVDLWQQIAFPPITLDESNEANDSSFFEQYIDYRLKDYKYNRQTINGFIKHFQACKDSCSADNAFLLATQNEVGDDVLRLQYTNYDVLSEDSPDEEWGNFDQELLGSEDEDFADKEIIPIFPVEEDDIILLTDTKEWVRKVIADFSVCPFTMDPNRAGIPMGGVRYSISRATTPEEAFLRYWEEVQILINTHEKVMSTTLLVFPEIELFGNYELFESFCECLSDALSPSSMALEKDIQLVFFHPKFQFRDGQARTGAEQGSPNFARRSPWPMINILRTNQVRAAQKGVPTGLVYKQNEERLSEIGTKTLEKMLYCRDWSALPSHQVHYEGVDDPRLKNVLTSLSYHKINEKDVKSSSKCPIDHTLLTETTSIPSNNNNDNNKVTPVPTITSTSNKNEEKIDYLKLAEDVEKWLNEQ
eukprot:gene5370-7448_t